MTSLLRFLVTLIVLAVAGYVAMLALTIFVEPEQREIVITVPPSRFEK